jgi:signal transduction histidine kinase
VTDGLVGVAVAAVQLLMLALGVNQGGPVPFAEPNALAVLLILAQGLPLVWRRRWPLLVFAVVLAANTAYYAIAFPPSQFDFGLPIALFTVAAERSQRTSLLAYVTILVLFTVQWAGGVGVYWTYANWVQVLYLVFFFSAVWAWGRYVRMRRAYTAELAARAERAERDRELEAQRAVAAERARIARELHDVVAHHLSVMVIQAGAARRLLDIEPEQTRAALAAIEESGRQGLGAMPGLLRALRDAEQADTLAPQPTLRELDTLVAQVKRPGCRWSSASKELPARCPRRSTCRPTASPRKPSPTPSSTPARPAPSSWSATAATPLRSPRSTTATAASRPPTSPPTGVGRGWSGCANGSACSAVSFAPAPDPRAASRSGPASRWRPDPHDHPGGAGR